MNTPQNPHSNSIAIIGIGCRFPGAHGPQAFWQLLANGVDAITEVPRNRFDIDKFYDPAPGAPGKISSRYGGFIDLVDHFDAEFFGISPREAEAIDPQQRIVLEVAYEAMEDAGLPPDRPIMPEGGVFLGLMSSDYLNNIYRGARDLDLMLATASSRATAATRISRSFNLEGPSLSIDSDRASSLTALHLACRSLRSGECAVALAGAANLILGPELSIACSRSGLLSADGRCRFCDARSNGIGRSEGVGVLVLKRLPDALADGNRIYAIIRGSAVRNNGSSSSDMLRPSVQAQVGVLRAALEDAGVRPEEIQYVEAHGTGTRVGDQVEIEALDAVFGQCRSAERSCLIGSVKTNVGHAEAAAGIAGVIKVALALQQAVIPKNLHFENPNPELALSDRHLQIPVQTVPWPARGQDTRFAGVSSFGLTGSLAHVVLQEPPPKSEEASISTEGCYYLLPLSAPSQDGLAAVANKFREWLLQDPVPKSLPRIGYSAGLHRQHHPHRLALVSSSLQEVTEQLKDYLDGRDPYQGASGYVISGRPKLVFVFPGQGSQWAGMGRELMANESVFRDTIALCDDIINAEAGWSVTALLRGHADNALLHEIDYVQPALSAVMVSLAALWRSWGIQPDAVLGLSMGEATAAYVAGILELHEAMAIVCRRSRLMKRLRAQGAIASIPLSQAEVEQALIPYGSQLSLAVIASPSSTMISGDPRALKELIDSLGDRGILSKHIRVDVASHSAQMDGLLEELREQLRDLRPKPGSVPLLSTVEAAFLDGSEMGADYWVRNLRQPVLQMNGFAQLLDLGYSAFLEVSPHPIVWNPLLETIQKFGAQATIAPSLRRGEGERKSLLRSAGTLYACGVSPDWKSLCGIQNQRFLPLPTYPWQRKPYWFEATAEARSECERVAASNGRAHSKPQPGVRKRLLCEIRNAPANERKQVLLAYLQTTVRRILKFSSDVPVLTDEPLRRMGLTSLMSTEFALELQTVLGFPYSATLLFNHPTLEQLADHLLSAVTTPHIDLTANVNVVAKPSSAYSPVIANPRENETIAIVGMACRFPGGGVTPDDYWRILHNGTDVISEVPAERWNIEDFYDPNPEASGKMCTRWAGLLDDIDCFDPSYFGLSRREAEVLDPHQRLLLEVTVEALENAGRSPSPVPASNAGVFVGIMSNYDFASVKGTFRDPSRIGAHDSTGQATSAAAGRLSYTLGFQGPCVAVDTACSSSLVAVHLACQALRARECEFAVAGGVNVILAPETTIAFSKTRMLSPTGRCKTFDARADGYVRGEGCGMVVLKRFSDAIRDRDNVLALIRGSAVNQDGRSSSLTAPNGLAQEAVIRRALEVAGVHPTEVDYVEAHGTGTALGDPIEVEALGNVLAEGRDPAAPFLVGSVKTNIGHLEAAAGVAGLIKVILSIQHEEIPPHLHLEKINPHISLAASKALIPSQTTPWPRGGKRRIAGISSFGFVGTNAHLVLEEPPERAESKLPRPVYRLLGLSAPSPRGVMEVAGRYAGLLSRQVVDVDDLCHTANTGRAYHSSRAAFIAAGIDDLRAKIHSFVEGAPAAGVFTQAIPGSSAPKVAFLFTGQGTQYPGMATQLLMTEPLFRAALERCAEIMDPLLPRGLFSLLQDGDPGLLQQTRFAQPALFALEYALFEQWRSWGVEPSFVMGHSLGECAAAVAAGVMSLEQAAKLVVTRGNLMQSIMHSCASASVFAGEKFVWRFVQPYAHSVAIAADNAPERVLIAGEEKPVQAVCATLEAAGVEVRRMAGPLAAHCPMMDPILDAFEAASARATYNEPEIPLVSTLTGMLVTEREISNPRHWRDHIRNKVRFREGVQALYAAGCRIFVEIGPRHTLLSLGKMCLPSPEITWLPSLSKEKHDQQQMLESLAELYVRGIRVRWEDRHRAIRGDKVPLPTTYFERTRVWPDPISRPGFGWLEFTPSATSEISDPVAPGRAKQEKQGARPLANEAKSGADKLHGLSLEERRSTILDQIIEIVRSVTAMKESETVPPDARFDSLGVDSLLSLDLIGALENFLNTNIPSTIIAHCPTIGSLATYLSGKAAETTLVSSPIEIESELSSLRETTAMRSVPIPSD